MALTRPQIAALAALGIDIDAWDSRGFELGLGGDTMMLWGFNPQDALKAVAQKLVLPSTAGLSARYTGLTRPGAMANLSYDGGGTGTGIRETADQGLPSLRRYAVRVDR